MSKYIHFKNNFFIEKNIELLTKNKIKIRKGVNYHRQDEGLAEVDGLVARLEAAEGLDHRTEFDL